MSYLALARKYRPRRFDDVLGQPHVVKALSHALAQDKLHPAILLTGTRGVGKTTLARIVAKSLNCEKGVSASACGQCSACREVDEGRSIDMLEIDAASHTGVDNVRELIDGAQYAPARSRYKVYLIDEVHMLSKPAFNALLKTLEEPPLHVKFILATTDPQKLLVTVLSRCLQFNLRRLPSALIREQLARVLADEKIQAEAGALAELARAADGSMRDGLSLLDQAIAYCGGNLVRSQVEDMLGTIGRQVLFEILRAISAGDAKGLLAGIEKLDAQAPDYAALLSDLAGYLQRIALLQLLPGSGSDDDDPALGELAQSVTAEDVQLYYQIAVAGRRDLPWTPDPRMGFEMALLRMLAFKPAEATATSVGRVLSPPSPGPAGRPLPQSPPSPRPSPSRGEGEEMERQTKITSPLEGEVGARSAPGEGGVWSARIESLGLGGYDKQLARHCTWIGQDNGTVRLGLASNMKHLLQDERRLAIEQALSRSLGQTVRVKIEVTEAVAVSPAQEKQKQVSDRQRAAELAIEGDPNVRALREKLGASVRAGSVQPLDP